MSKKFTAISFEKFKVGKLIKRSKNKYTWKFEIEEELYTLDLFVSRMSGKRTVILNGIKLSTQKTSGLGSTYIVNIPKHKVIIYELGDNAFELRINNIAFKVSNNEKISNSLQVPENIRIRNKSSGNDNWMKEDFGFEKADAKEIKKIKHKESSPSPLPSPEKKVTRPKVVEKIEVQPEKPSKSSEIFNVFDMPEPSLMSLPIDLFSTPLGVQTNGPGNNPFEDVNEIPIEVKSQPIIKIEEVKQQDFFNLVDLDGLHLGDNYSPAFAKRIEEANKPITIQSANVPNVPMQNLLAQRSPTSQQMPPGMMNPMGNMMMNPFMTGMMMPQWNGYYQNPK